MLNLVIHRDFVSNQRADSIAYSGIPYATEQGIFKCVSGNFSQVTGNFEIRSAVYGPANQSGLYQLTCECRSKRRGTAAFRGPVPRSGCRKIPISNCVSPMTPPSLRRGRSTTLRWRIIRSVSHVRSDLCGRGSCNSLLSCWNFDFQHCYSRSR